MNEPSKSNYRDPQYVIAIGVTIISLCALIVSVMQTQLMRQESELLREYSRASVWPRLEFGLSKSHNPTDGSLTQFTLSLSNSGVGPAIITDVKVSYNDKTATDWWHLFRIQEIPDSIETYITNSSLNKQIIKIGETITILDLSKNLPLAEEFMKRLENLSVEIYYESIYKEKWKYNIEETIKLENFEGLPEEDQFDN